MKTYLRFVLKDTFGVITSTQSNALLDASGGLAITGALQDVAVWSLRQGSLVRVFRPEGEAASKGEVSHLALSPDGKSVAAGYSTGAVRIYVLSTGATSVTLSGHKAAVTAGRYSTSGALLATGSADTDIVIWDTVADAGLYRLRGHRDGVTGLAFLPAAVRGLARGLASCSKDTLVKIWDLDTQHCVQTIVGHRSEVWSLDINPAGTRLATGASDGQLRVWALDSGSGDDAESGGGESNGELAGSTDAEPIFAEYMGSMVRQSNDRAALVRFHKSGALLGVQGAGKTVEVFAVAGEAEAKRRRRRRLRRQREKLQKQQRKLASEGAEGSSNGAWGADAEAAGADAAAGGEGEKANEGPAASDELESRTVLRSGHKINSFDFHPEILQSSTTGGGGGGGSGSTKLLLALQNNALELWNLRGLEGAAAGGARKRRRRNSSVDLGADDETAETAETAGDDAGKRRKRKNSSVDAADATATAAAAPNGSGAGSGAAAGAAAELAATLDLHGHRSDVRAVAVSSDDQLVASVSHGLAKVWNAKTRRCVRSSPVGFGLCVAFLPGDRHIAVGTKEGNLQVVDLASGDVLRDYDAHAGAVWSLDVRPDGRGLATGSADASVKFWDFEVAPGGGLALVHTRTLKAAGDVLCVRYSRHRRAEQLLVAVAVLDGTVKIFHDDSLKFFLSLYGHKLPVMGMDCSDDGALLATGSADKTLKFWGLDFGDCHRSILAHGDSVMAVKFLPGTHHLLTASKDRSIKYWDADRFELILDLKGHQGEVWALAVATSGGFAVSGGHDRSLRLWERTDEMVFLEEERERRLEDMFEAELDADARGPPSLDPDRPGGGDPSAEGEAAAAEAAAAGGGTESAAATRRSVESVKAGERLMEALELASAEDAADTAAAAAAAASGAAAATRRPSPLLLGLTPLRYVLRALQMVRAPELEQALLVLPLVQVEWLAMFLARLLAAGLEVELCARCAVFLLRTHHVRVVANRAMAGTLDDLRRQLRRRLEGARDAVGTNVAALRLLRRKLESAATAHLFEANDEGSVA